MSDNLIDSQIARDMVIQNQPILWAEAMLKEAEKITMEDARDAVLARVGATLFTRYGVSIDYASMRRANDVWVER